MRLGRKSSGMGLVLALTLAGCGATPQHLGSSHSIALTSLTIGKTTPSAFHNTGGHTVSLSMMEFLSPTLGFGFAQSGTHLFPVTTQDGGKNWNSLSVPQNIFPQLFDMTTPTEGFMTGCSSTDCQPGSTTTLLRTTDGGQSWQTVFQVPAHGSIQSIDFLSATTGWTIQSLSQPSMSSQIAFTQNSGKNWAPVSTPSSLFPGMTVIDFLNSHIGWLLSGGEPGAGSQSKTLYYTTNGGHTWAVIARSAQMGGGSSGSSSATTLSTGGYVEDLHFVTAHVGFMATDRGGIYRTIDGGHRWTPVFSHQFSPGNDMVPSLDFLSKNQGKILIQNFGISQLWATQNGGANWQDVYPPVAPNLGNVSFATPSIGVGLGASSMQEAGSTPLITTDGGNTWNPVAAPVGLHGLTWSNSHTLWGIAANGALYRSLDRGSHFRAVSLPNGATALRIAMASTMHGVLITRSSITPRVWTTNDGGIHWTLYHVPFAPSRMVAAGQDAYWAVGTNLSTLKSIHRYEQQHGSNPKAVKIYAMKHPLVPYLYHFRHGQWSQASLPQKGFPLGLRFLGTQFGYFWTRHNLMITTNGGKSWTRNVLPHGIGVTSIWFASPRVGWLTSNNGAPLYHTTNGGVTWISGP